MRAHGSFTVASALMSTEMLEQALLYPKQSVELDMTFQNIMSVNVPVYHFKTKSDDAGEIYPYGFATTSGELDGAVEALSGVLQDMLRLAEIEKTSQLLAEEIEKTRRRVNALEYVKIPQMEEAIQYITMKLDENERANTIRLMKVKDMLLKEAIEERREEDARATRTFGWNFSFLATKSVSALTSTTTAFLWSSVNAVATIPSAAIRPAFLAAPASPFSLRNSTALSISPSVAASAFLQSIIPAPVISLKSFTIAAVTAAISFSSNYKF